MYIKKIFLELYDFIIIKKRALYDYLTAQKVHISIGDILSYRGFVDCEQFIVASRLLDIERYFSKTDTNFSLQRLTTLCLSQDYYDAHFYYMKFERTILSYLKNGYIESSFFILDKEKLLRNGTHRSAMHLYLKIYELNAKVLSRRFPVYDNYMELFKKKLDPDIYRMILDRLNKIQNDLIEDGVAFCGVIPEKSSLSMLFPILKDDVHEKKEYFFDNSKDDLFLGILNRKCSGCKLVLFTLDNPEYEVVSGSLESKKIKRAIAGSDNYISSSCYEGKKVFDSLKPFFLKYVVSE